MSISKEYLKGLLKKFEAGECNSEELKVIDDWYNSLNEIDQNQTEVNEVSKMKLKEKVWESILREIKKTKKSNFSRQTIPLFLKSIAALFILGVGIFWVMQNSGNRNERNYITVSVARGETKKIKLPDSTTIWLNSNSKIKYPAEFNRNRVVYLLEGEGFFNVTHDSNHPFTVYTSSGIAVEDLGTEFNIKSYSALDFIRISVLKGKVAVKDSAVTLTELNRTEGVLIDKTLKSINRINIEDNEMQGWRNGDIILNNVSFNELALALENNFQVRLNYNKEILSGCRSSISFKTTENLKDIMDDLAVIYKFQYVIANDQVNISGNGCK